MTEEKTNSILIVDDSPEQIRFVGEILRAEGWKVYAALSCEAAFTLLSRHLPDLMLVDIVMPEMDGFTFCSRIKEDERTSDIPVIFATAYNDREYIGKSFAVGGSDYVVKPFIKEELLERVKVRLRLANKRKQLERAYDELDKFCYTVSPDIRAPLYVIQQLTTLLVQENEAGNLEESRKICEMLQRKAKQAASMTEGLHHFSKVFYEELKWENVDMDTLFREVYEELALLEKNRVIRYEQMKLPSVQGDADLLRLVVQNILSNALKFTRERETTQIRVEAHREDNMMAYLVTDNGVGFDQQYKDEIFKVFRKLHSDVEYEGDGIGLASVRRIISRHRGEVEINSAPGEVTTVRIVLPVEPDVQLETLK